MTSSDNDHIICPKCGAEIRLPSAGPRLTVTCPECGGVIVPDLPEKPRSKRKAFLWTGLAAVILILLAWVIFIVPKGRDSKLSGVIPPSPSWLTIRYGELVDGETLTNIGESIRNVLWNSHFRDSLKGPALPYLDPYSLLCHDALLALNGPDTLPLVNIVSHYSVGSAQPAWVALFREGKYQLYYNSQLIRVFIEGENLPQAIYKHQPVIRHAIAGVISNQNTSIDRIEIYNFFNVYDSLSVVLNTSPAVYTPDEFDLKAHGRSLDLASVHEFLKSGAALEAMKVDSLGNFYLYGRESSPAGLGGSPLSLADLAVFYRAVFYCGLNAPSASIGKNADNRYATVYYGGCLENTRIGDLLLDADKCFKTVCAGIDPLTHKVVTDRVLRCVPDFLTVDQRKLLHYPKSGFRQVDFWLYPDSIGVVTDRSLGVAESDQFVADIDRQGKDRPSKQYVLDAVKHFNQNYAGYEKAFEPLKNLRTIAKVTALFGWLKRMRMDSKVSLDEFLSVELPPYTTPAKVHKMLALTAVGSSQDPGLTEENVRNNSKTYDLSKLLDDCQPGLTDWRQLELAQDNLKGSKLLDLVPARYQNVKSQLQSLDASVKTCDGKLDSLDAKLNLSEKMLDNTDRASLARHNNMVQEYNRLLATRKSTARAADSLYYEMLSMKIVPSFAASVGGGISLHPSQFKRTYVRSKSPLITRITSLNGKFRTEGEVSKSGEWIRSNPGEGRTIVSKLPCQHWTRSENSGDEADYEYTSDNNGQLSLIKEPDDAGWRTETTVDGVTDAVEFVQGDRQLIISHPGAAISGKGNLQPNNRMIEFHK